MKSRSGRIAAETLVQRWPNYYLYHRALRRNRGSGRNTLDFEAIKQSVGLARSIQAHPPACREPRKPGARDITNTKHLVQGQPLETHEAAPVRMKSAS